MPPTPRSAIRYERFLACLALCLAALPGRAQPFPELLPQPVPGTPREPFYSLSSRGDTVLAGGPGVVWFSVNGGRNWVAANALPDGATSVDAVVATDAGWFASAYGRGVYRSTNEGKDWTAVNAGLVGMGALDVWDFEVHGTDLYAGTQGAGVFRMDLGDPDHWTSAGSEFAQNEASTVESIALRGDVMVAAAGGNGLVFVRDLTSGPWVPARLPYVIYSVQASATGFVASGRFAAFWSEDDGATWQQTGPLAGSGPSATLAAWDDPAAATEAWLAQIVSGTESLLYRSADFEQPWEVLGLVPQTLAMLMYDGLLIMAQSDGLRVLDPAGGTGVDPGAPAVDGLALDPPYPNPARDRVTLSYASDLPGSLRVEVLDALGRRVWSGDLRASGSPGDHVAIDVAGWSPGLYLVRISGGPRAASRAFVVRD